MRIPARIARTCLAVALAALAAACSYPVRNQELASLSPREGYRWSALAGGELDDTLIVVTASGGGTRATALALSTLQGLHRLELASGRSLADEVDLISSVSGGSVTAAWFALEGTGGFDTLRKDFIEQDGIAAILWAGLNPVGLARLATPSRERIDLLIDYLDSQLFKERTYAALLAKGTRPYLVLNAADMTASAPFPFTQSRFDLLCSDLARLKLSVATAASAAFPVALSPVTLKNYSHCAAQPRWPDDWPPQWIKNAAKTDWHTDPERARRGRLLQGYADGNKRPDPAARLYIHLLDGGIADNLGVAEPIRLLSTQDVSPRFLNDIARGKIRRVVFVMINARSAKVSELNTKPDTPGIFDMLGATLDSSIDNNTYGTAERLRVLLRDRLEAYAADPGLPPELAANVRALKTRFVAVDFDAIHDADCRRRFQAIPTSWTLRQGQVKALLIAGGALLRKAPEMERVVRELGVSGFDGLPTERSACAAIAEAEEE